MNTPVKKPTPAATPSTGGGGVVQHEIHDYASQGVHRKRRSPMSFADTMPSVAGTGGGGIPEEIHDSPYHRTVMPRPSQVATTRQLKVPKTGAAMQHYLQGASSALTTYVKDASEQEAAVAFLKKM